MERRFSKRAGHLSTQSDFAKELCELGDVATSCLSNKGAGLMTENVICSTESA